MYWVRSRQTNLLLGMKPEAGWVEKRSAKLLFVCT